MKQKNFLSLLIICLIGISSFGQSRGDLAFTAINVDGDDDFAVVALVDITANTTIYFTDYEWDEGGSAFVETGTDGFIEWNTGSNIIKAGTIIVFTDVDNSSNTNYGVSVGTITSPENIALLASGETFFAYVGTDKDTPTTFITGIKNGSISTELTGTGLGGTDLVVGTDFLEFNPTTSPDGGVYSGSRSDQASYSNYLSIITDKSNWTRNTEDGEALLPFSQEAFTINTTNWTGTTSSVWNLAGNWDNGIPTTSSLAIIPNVANAPIISSGTEALVGNLTLQTVETLTINSGNALTVNGNLTVTDSKSLIMNSGSSLIVKGTSSGKLLYKRNIPVANVWYLVTNPLIGGSTEQDDFLLNDNPNIAISAGNSNPAIGTYNYGGTAGWRYDFVDFSGGIGFATRLTSTADLQFTGTILTDDLAKDIFSTGDGFRLHGNPYPSYIAANNNANATNNFLKYNTSTGQNDIESATIWFWDHTIGLSGEYTTINQASPARFIAPGQGFFVKKIAISEGDAKIDFKENMQSHQATDIFNKSQNTRPEIQVFISSETYYTSTDIYYINGTTTSFDNGYDSSIFGGTSANYKVYSGLVSDSKGEKLAIQSLPDSDYENMVVPIGLNADSGKEIKFTVEALNLPTDINVFLEDRLTNTFTRLDEANSEYTITLKDAMNGIGRFYLHTKTSSVLSTESAFLESVSIYKINNNELKISGLQQGMVRVSLFNIIGKQVMQTSFEAATTNTVSLPNTSTGIYLVKLETSKGNITKKIILE